MRQHFIPIAAAVFLVTSLAVISVPVYAADGNDNAKPEVAATPDTGSDAAAVAASGNTNPADVVKIEDFGDVIRAGRWPMSVLIALSVFTTFLLIYFLFALRAKVLYPQAWCRDAEEAASNGDVEALRVLCQGTDCAVSRIVDSALENFSAATEADGASMVQETVQDEGAREASSMWQRIQYLMDVAVVAPMVGLLGTVLGMLRAFANVTLEVGAVNPLHLAQGVTQALITTAAGLSVGIFAMILYAVFRGRVHKLTAGMENRVNRILRLILANRG